MLISSAMAAWVLLCVVVQTGHSCRGDWEDLEIVSRWYMQVVESRGEEREVAANASHQIGGGQVRI